jgi:hypothetical protein
MRTLFLLLALPSVLAGVHVADVSARARALRAFIWSSDADVRPVDAYAPSETGACPRRAAGDVEALARALITVESFATPSVQAWAKGATVRLASALGLRVPDLTYGQGRVRLSTARRVMGAEAADSGLALRLLDPCETKAIVASMVAELLSERLSGDRLDLATVRQVARAYNGQGEAHTPEAAIAHETYNRLVYALFQHYRFEGLRDRRDAGARPRPVGKNNS